MREIMVVETKGYRFTYKAFIRQSKDAFREGAKALHICSLTTPLPDYARVMVNVAKGIGFSRFALMVNAKCWAPSRSPIDWFSGHVVVRIPLSGKAVLLDTVRGKMAVKDAAGPGRMVHARVVVVDSLAEHRLTELLDSLMETCTCDVSLCGGRVSADTLNEIIGRHGGLVDYRELVSSVR